MQAPPAPDDAAGHRSDVSVFMCVSVCVCVMGGDWERCKRELEECKAPPALDDADAAGHRPDVSTHTCIHTHAYTHTRLYTHTLKHIYTHTLIYTHSLLITHT